MTFWLVVVAAFTVGMGAFGVWVARQPDGYETYQEACRALGGVPIQGANGVQNCARPEGGWIDVR